MNMLYLVRLLKLLNNAFGKQGRRACVSSLKPFQEVNNLPQLIKDLFGYHLLLKTEKTRLTNTEKCKSNFKIGSHNTIHTFKNYFATVFLVFSNK